MHFPPYYLWINVTWQLILIYLLQLVEIEDIRKTSRDGRAPSHTTDRTSYPSLRALLDTPTPHEDLRGSPLQSPWESASSVAK